jgi:hypothetical protein
MKNLVPNNSNKHQFYQMSLDYIILKIIFKIKKIIHVWQVE